MSDYSRVWDFSTKTGDPILGSDVDDEFDALVIAVASKVDESREGAANGIATLGATLLIPVGISGDPDAGGGQIPEASATALGAVELATTAEAQALTDTLRVLTPDTLDDVLTDNAGILKDLFSLTDPGADRIVFWNNTGSNAAFLSLSSDFTISGAQLSLAATIASQVFTVLQASTFTATTANITTLEMGGGATITGVSSGQIDVDNYPVYTNASTSYASSQITFSTSAPTTEGANGDIWFQYT